MASTDVESQLASPAGPDRRRVLKLLAVGLLLLLIPVALTRLYVTHTDFSTVRYYEETRVRDLMAALPDIVRTPGRLVLIQGSSLVEWGFRPEMFDEIAKEAGKPVTSFNLGVPGLNTHFQLLFIKQLARAFERAHRKPALLVLDFTFVQATEAAEARLTPPSDQLLAALEGEHALLSAAARDPLKSLRPALYHYVYDSLNPSNLRYKFTDWTDRVPSWWPVGAKRDNSPFGVLSLVLARRPPNDDRWSPRRWSPATRGAPDVLRDDTAAAYATYAADAATPEGLVRAIEENDESDDIFELRFSDRLVTDFIDACRVARQLSEQTLLVLSPINPGIEKLRSAAAIARRQRVLERIENGCGLKFIRLGDGFDERDFFDVVHVNQLSGRTKYTRAVVDLALPKL